MADNSVQQTISIGQKIAAAIDSGYKVLGLVLLSIVLGAGIWYAWHRFFHKSDIIVPPAVAVNPDFSKTDFSDEQALLQYVGTWLNMHAPFVLNDCVVNHIQPEKCMGAIK